MSGPKQDRLLLTRACKANLSQIFGLYPDPKNEVQEKLEAAIEAGPAARGDRSPGRDSPHVARDRRGRDRRRGRGDRPEADLHRRRPPPLRDRLQLSRRACRRPVRWRTNNPANFVLMMCVGMEDPGLIVLPTHRLFRGLPAMNSGELIAKLGDAFTTRVAGEGTDLAQHRVGRDRNRGRSGDARPVHRGGRTLDAGPNHRRRACADGQDRLGA